MEVFCFNGTYFNFRTETFKLHSLICYPQVEENLFKSLPSLSYLQAFDSCPEGELLRKGGRFEGLDVEKKSEKRCRVGNHFFLAFISEMDSEVRHNKLISLWLEVSLPSLSHPLWGFQFLCSFQHYLIAGAWGLMTPLGHRIASVPWSIRQGESGFGWVAAVGTVRWAWWGDSGEEAANSSVPIGPPLALRTLSELLTQECTLQEVWIWVLGYKITQAVNFGCWHHYLKIYLINRNNDLICLIDCKGPTPNQWLPKPIFNLEMDFSLSSFLIPYLIVRLCINLESFTQAIIYTLLYLGIHLPANHPSSFCSFFPPLRWHWFAGNILYLSPESAKCWPFYFTTEPEQAWLLRSDRDIGAICIKYMTLLGENEENSRSGSLPQYAKSHSFWKEDKAVERMIFRGFTGF